MVATVILEFLGILDFGIRNSEFTYSLYHSER